MVSLEEKKRNLECTVKTDYIFHNISLLFNPDHEPRETEVCNIAHQILEIKWLYLICSNTDIPQFATSTFLKNFLKSQ